MLLASTRNPIQLSWFDSEQSEKINCHLLFHEGIGEWFLPRANVTSFSRRAFNSFRKFCQVSRDPKKFGNLYRLVVVEISKFPSYRIFIYWWGVVELEIEETIWPIKCICICCFRVRNNGVEIRFSSRIVYSTSLTVLKK